MKYRIPVMLCAAVLSVAAPTLALAQDTSPPFTPAKLDAINKAWEKRIDELSRSPDAKLAANKRVALEFLYGLVLSLEGRTTVEQVTERYLSPTYIQHDPNIPTGRDGFNRWFNAGAMAPNTPTAPKVDMKLIGIPTMVTAVAEGDMVATMSHHQFPDPTSPGDTFDWFHTAIFRIANGKIEEHWNEGMKGSYWCRLGHCDPKKK